MEKQQKLNLKKRTRSQRQFLIPLVGKTLLLSNLKPIKEQRRRVNTELGEYASKFEDLPHESVLRDGIIKTTTEKNIQAITKLNSRKSDSINASKRIRMNLYQKVFKQKKSFASMQPESNQRIWEDIDQRKVPKILYEPLLGRRRLNKIPICHKDKASRIQHLFEVVKEENSSLLYKHPLFQNKLPRSQTQEVKPVGRIRNQTSQVASLKFKMMNLSANKRAFRKVGNAVLFIFILRRFSKVYRGVRQQFIFHLSLQNLKKEMLRFKQCLWINCQEFTEVVAEHQHVNFIITKKDSEVLVQKKREHVNRFLSVLIGCLKAILSELKGTKLLQITYHFCKHGSYSCGSSILTQQQLCLVCLSEQQGYIRSNQQLQKSAIISLIFMKIILYSTLLKPHTMNLKYDLIRSQYFQSNIKLLGNILYVQMQKIQAKYLKKCDSYDVGNWTKLQQKFIIKQAVSMTTKEGIYDKNQLISGLMKQKMIKQYPDHDGLREKQLQQIVDVLHRQIARYHAKILRKCI